MTAVELAESGRLPQRGLPGPATPDPGPEAPAGRHAQPSTGSASGTGTEEELRSFTPESRLGLLTPGEVIVSDAGVVHIRKGSRTYTFDLYDRATEVRVHGKPGQRRWRVEFQGEDAVVVDARMVDPEAFTREVLRWRPDAAR